MFGRFKSLVVAGVLAVSSAMTYAQETPIVPVELKPTAVVTKILGDNKTEILGIYGVWVALALIMAAAGLVVGLFKRRRVG